MAATCSWIAGIRIGGDLQRWRALVSEGLSLIIYAEGTRSANGHVARFKAGSFLLAIEAGLPIVPLAIIDTRQVMPKNRLRTEPADVTLVVHDAIQPPALPAPTVRDAKALADRAQAIVSAAVEIATVRHAIIGVCADVVTAIIAAGGRGTRFGGDRLKQLVEVQGQAILERSVRAFLSHPEISEVIVALPAELMDPPPHYLDRAHLVRGGDRRQDPVANAFRAASTASDVVVIHDAARPFVSASLISRTIASAATNGAALAAIAARDTVKRVGRDTVLETLPRETIYLAQTPQAFRRHVLASALAIADDATDEAALAERAGHTVHIVNGDASNIRITTADDLRVAEALAQSERNGNERGHSKRAPARTGRAGTGYDLHRLVDGRPLIIGGVTIPAERGALGHSDADVACHAATDAILGAACLGDIGNRIVVPSVRRSQH